MLFRPAFVLSSCLGLTAFSNICLADPFEGAIEECVKVKRVIEDRIYILAESEGEIEIKISDENPRKGEIVFKAQQAASRNQSLCGTVRGIGIKSSAPQQVSQSDLETVCEQKKQDLKKEKGWAGFLSSAQNRELETAYALCIASKGKENGSQSAIDRYYSCRTKAGEIMSKCTQSEKASCIKSDLIKENFIENSDFALLRSPSGELVVQCRIDGRAPSRLEIGAPLRGNIDATR